MTLIFYLIFGLMPSLIWLLFYLRKDAHPESNKMILKIFFWGMISAAIAAAIEIAISKLLLANGTSKEFAALFPLPSFLFYHFLLVSFIEEMSKFIVVKAKVLKSPEFDEPLDLMLYMIIAALGFAALENLLYLLPLLFPDREMTLSQAGVISFFRFAGATFLHALSSGTIGYFLAKSIYKKRSKILALISGIALATLLHGLFNISIIGLETGLSNSDNVLFAISIGFLAALLVSMSVGVSNGFKRLKGLAGVCKI